MDIQKIIALLNKCTTQSYNNRNNLLIGNSITLWMHPSAVQQIFNFSTHTQRFDAYKTEMRTDNMLTCDAKICHFHLDNTKLFNTNELYNNKLRLNCICFFRILFMLYNWNALLTQHIVQMSSHQWTLLSTDPCVFEMDRYLNDALWFFVLSFHSSQLHA